MSSNCETWVPSGVRSRRRRQAIEVSLIVPLHRVFERVLAEVPTRTIHRVRNLVLGVMSMDVSRTLRWIRLTLKSVVQMMLAGYLNPYTKEREA